MKKSKRERMRALAFATVVTLFTGLLPQSMLLTKAEEVQVEELQQQTDQVEEQVEPEKVEPKEQVEAEYQEEPEDQQEPEDKVNLNVQEQTDESLLSESNSDEPLTCNSKDIKLSLKDGLLTISGNGDYYERKDNSYMELYYFYHSNYYNFIYKHSLDIKKVKVDVTGITSTCGMFFGLRSVEEIDLSGLDTSQVDCMIYMFNCFGSSALQELDLGNLNTGNVVNMANMFNCCKVGRIKFGDNFKTDKVTDMSNMFSSCSNLQELCLDDNFNTSNVTNMSSMFQSCGYNAITKFDLGNKFYTNNVQNMECMFMGFGYDTIETLDLGENFDTKNVTNMHYMFDHCGYKKMTMLDLGENFDTSNVTNMNGMFHSCGYESMPSLYLGEHFDTQNVEDMDDVFHGTGYYKMTDLNLGDKFTTDHATDMERMFFECGNRSLKNLYLGYSFKKFLDLKNDYVSYILFQDLGTDTTKIYINEELRSYIEPIFTDSYLDYDFNIKKENLIDINFFDLSGIFGKTTVSANGSFQTFDRMNYVIDIYYSDKQELDKSNYLEMGSLNQPSYKTRGKRTIYYYGVKSQNTYNYSFMNPTGSFDFEITCTHPITEIRNQKDATYEEDGYTGDTYCVMCDELLVSGNNIPKLTKDDPQNPDKPNPDKPNPDKPNPNPQNPDKPDPEKPDPQKTYTITLNVDNITLQKGKETDKVVAKVCKGDKIVKYESSDTKIATVSKKGVIKGARKGTATITYISQKGAKAELKVKVQNGKVTTKRIKIVNVKNNKLVMSKRKSFKLKVELNPITSTDKITYKSLNKKIATVSKDGKIKAIKKGKTYILVKSGKKYVKIKVTVK